MNKYFVSGRLTKDPASSKGTVSARTYFTVAAERPMNKAARKKAEEEGRAVADFPFFVAYGKLADVILESFSKGDTFAGMAEFETYVNKNGDYGYDFKVTSIFWDLCKTKRKEKHLSAASDAEESDDLPESTGFLDLPESYDEEFFDEF